MTHLMGCVADTLVQHLKTQRCSLDPNQAVRIHLAGKCQEKTLLYFLSSVGLSSQRESNIRAHFKMTKTQQFLFSGDYAQMKTYLYSVFNIRFNSTGPLILMSFLADRNIK